MKQYYILMLACLSVAVSASAQSFLNGSFEPRGAVYPCTDNSFSVFNSNMGNVWAIGPSGRIYVGSDSCGLPQSGLYYVGLQAKGASYNAVVLKLDKPLVKGNSYVLNFYAKKTDSGAAVRLRIGFSDDSVAIVDTINTLKGPIDSMWTLEYDSIVANVSAEYITVQAVDTAVADTAMAYIDGFTLINTTTAVPTISGNSGKGINVYPNPFGNIVTLTINNQIPKPYKMSIYDMMGRTIMQRNTSERTITITRANLSSGVYLIKIRDGNGHYYYQRLVSQ